MKKRMAYLRTEDGRDWFNFVCLRAEGEEDAEAEKEAS